MLKQVRQLHNPEVATSLKHLLNTSVVVFLRALLITNDLVITRDSNPRVDICRDVSPIALGVRLQ